MKKVIISIILLSFILSGCLDNSIEVPDIKGLNEEDAKTVLINNKLIPNIKHEFNIFIKEKDIVSVNPIIGTKVEENTKILVTYSNGEKIIEAKDSNIEWYHIDPNKPDEWSFFTPYINREEGMLYIELNATLGKSVELNDKYDSGYGLVTAVVNDPQDKRIPTQLEYFGSKIINKGEETRLVVRLPLTDLEKEKLTDFSLYISIIDNDENKDINLNFSISW